MAVDSRAAIAYPEPMSLVVDQQVTLPTFTPYPQFGRVAALTDEGVHVVDVHCGDPRCPTEHAHGPQVWPLAEVESVRAYQPRAPWEWGRKTSPNTPVD